MKGLIASAVPQPLRQPLNFVLIYFTYIFFYLCRKNYAFWLNELVRVEGRDKGEVSVFGSIMEMSYGAGKLITGPMLVLSSFKMHSPL